MLPLGNGKINLLFRYLELFYRNASDCDKLVFCGGTQFTLSKRLKAITVLQLLQVYIFKLFRRDIEARGIGLIYFDSSFNRTILKILFKNFSTIEVRDIISYETLRQFNLEVELREDLVLQHKRLFISDTTYGSGSKTVYLTLPSSDYARVVRFEKELKYLVDEINYRGLKVVGLSMQEHQDHSDKMCFERLGVDYIVINSIREMIDEVALSKAVLGMRFHSCVLAHINKTKLVCLGNSIKVMTFAKKYEYMNWPSCSNSEILEYLER